MKSVARMSSKMEAEFAAQALTANGIEAHVHGAKEYASHWTGVDFGTYDIMVDDENVDKASVMLRQNALALVKGEVPKRTPKAYLKRAVIFSMFAAFLMPLVFNFASLYNLRLYWKEETNHSRRLLWTVIVLFLQLPALFFPYIFLTKAIFGL